MFSSQVTGNVGTHTLIMKDGTCEWYRFTGVGFSISWHIEHLTYGKVSQEVSARLRHIRCSYFYPRFQLA